MDTFILVHWVIKQKHLRYKKCKALQTGYVSTYVANW